MKGAAPYRTAFLLSVMDRFLRLIFSTGTPNPKKAFLHSELDPSAHLPAMVHVLTPPPTEASRHEIVWLAGPRLIGLLFNWGLLGVLTTQIYIYHVNFPRDKRRLKALVYGIYLLDWAQTCSATYDAFRWFVYDWGDIPALFLRYSGFFNVPLLSSVIGAIVQASPPGVELTIFYGWRIWIFSRSKVMFVIVFILAVVQLGGGIATAYYMFIDASETSRAAHTIHSVGVRLGGSALVDIVISVSMTYYLLRCRAQALEHTTNAVTRLVRLTIETGTITVFAATLDLVFYLTEKNGLHQVSGVTLSKLYSNTLMVLFNNRLVELRTRDTISGENAALAFRPGRSKTETMDTGDFQTITVKVDKESFNSID
ncbi:hypothetical protein MVEN_00804300 [Mycena venus]|uniref:DUF6534 domain-containing protein n=1 Tax=Mycena venus TaxID=2733690 RepID=A0A8H6YLY6_9AGAR|nr:hypothetical protein MVEN_00804300 [Mycena venus]